MFPRFIYIAHVLVIHSFSLLNNISLYGDITVCLSVNQLTNICFQFGAGNNAAMNICIHVFRWICFYFSWIVSGLDFWFERPGSKFMFKFGKILPNSFPKWLPNFTFPSAMSKGFCFSTSVPTHGIIY